MLLKYKWFLSVPLRVEEKRHKCNIFVFMREIPENSSYEEDLRRLMCFLVLLQVARSDYGGCARSTRVKQKCDWFCKTHANIPRPSSAII